MVDINFFNENGYVVINDVLTSDEVNRYKIVVDDELDLINKQINNRKDNNLEWPLHKLEAAKNTDILKLACSHTIINLIKPLLGNDIQLQHSKFAIKAPGKDLGTIDWHQDFAFFPHTNDSLVAVSVALCDITISNGGMTMIRGSHLHGLLSHYDDSGKFIERCNDELIYQCGSKHDALVMPAGSIAIHHCLTVHSSSDNLTNKPRYMLVFQYRASDAYQLADGVWTDTGVQVSGKYTGKVRIGGKFLQRNKINNDIELTLPKSLRYGTSYPYGDAYHQIGNLANDINRN